MIRLRTAFGSLVPPVVFGAIFLGAWQWFVVARDVKPFVLVAPSDVWAAMRANAGSIWDAMQVSGLNALLGLVSGVLVAAAVALVAAGRPRVGDLIGPLATVVNAVPIVVVVAVLTRMYPSDSQIPRRLMVLLVVFFVVFVNVLRGLRDSQPTQLELMKSYAATASQQFRKVRVPNALPFLFTGIRVAAPLAVITAVVAEYFGGTKNGLGSSITSFLSTSKKDVGLAYVAGASALGLAFFAGAAVLEYVAVPWQRQRDRSR